MSAKVIAVAVAAVGTIAVIAGLMRDSSAAGAPPLRDVIADPITCDFSAYHEVPGVAATMQQGVLAVTWTGRDAQQVRARFAVSGGQPTVADLAVRGTASAAWVTLGEHLVPEYQVVTGIRRMGQDQARTLQSAGIELTPEVVEKNRWEAFWDAPLVVPGDEEMQDSAARMRGLAAAAGRPIPDPEALLTPSRAYGPPRTAAEIRRADASFHATSCSVKTDGQALEVTFPGLTMGIFSGDLRFTMYQGTNLLRMDAVAATNEEWVAYKYDAGLSGFSTALTPHVRWRDTGGHLQTHRFGGAVNDSLARVRAQNRLMIAEGPSASLATFTPPHSFFFAREKDTNLGYVWYRKDAEGRFGMGVGMPEREDEPQYVENFALYNAPPGTEQKMGMYFYATADAAGPTRDAVMAFTHDDTFTPVPGYKTFVNHFHLDFTGRQRASGSLDTAFQDLAAMKSIGLNIIGLSDFHFELARTDPGPLRFKDQRDYFEASRRASDVDFLVVPWEEPSAFFGGHYNILWPKRVFWSKVREAGQPFMETDPTYGKVYHTGSAEDVQKMMDLEGVYWYHSHPRTKGTTGYPDLIFDKAWMKNDSYLGIAFKPGMGQDESEARLCEYRCFDALDTMNNLYTNLGLQPKFLIADIDTYRKGPEDDLYANFPVNYVKLDRVPGPDEDWTPILTALRDGDFFVTTGEILISRYSVDGTGPQRTITAQVDWTFPLAFVEVVWGDGHTVDRQIVSATDLGAFGTKAFSIPFDATGKSWVRFAVWDSAGNGAFVQPVWLNPPGTTTN